MLEVIAGAYGVASSGNLGIYQFETDHYLTIPCAAASKFSHNAGWAGVLQRLGFSDTAVNDLIGCRQEVIDANWSRLTRAIDQYTLDEPAFRNLCPWVIIPDAQKSFWQLPKDYQETRIGNAIGVWSAPVTSVP